MELIEQAMGIIIFSSFVFGCYLLYFEKKKHNALKREKEVIESVVEQTHRLFLHYDIKNDTGVCKGDLGTFIQEEISIDHFQSYLIRHDIILKTSVADYNRFFDEIRSGQREGEGYFHIKLPNEQIIWLYAQYTTLFDEEGNPIECVISSMDVTEQRQKEMAYENLNYEIRLMIKECVLVMDLNFTQSCVDNIYSIHDEFRDVINFDISLTDNAQFIKDIVSEDYIQSFMEFVSCERLDGLLNKGITQDTFEYSAVLEGEIGRAHV